MSTSENQQEQNIGSSNETPNTNKASSGPGFSITYMIPLLAYFFISYRLYMGSIGEDGLPNGKSPQQKITMILLGFLVFTFLVIYGFIVKEMSKTCRIGSKNFALKAFLYTFTPFIFILGSLVVILMIMPGWKAPFSNTIGYFIVKNVIERRLFKLQEWIKTDKVNEDGLNVLNRFNSKNMRTFFINELTPDNFFNGVKSLNIGPGTQFEFHEQKVDNPKDPGTKMLNPKSNGLNIMKSLYSAIIIKDMISEFIWLFVGGVLSYSVSQIYAMDHVCNTEKVENQSEIERQLEREYGDSNPEDSEVTPEYAIEGDD